MSSTRCSLSSPSLCIRQFKATAKHPQNSVRNAAPRRPALAYLLPDKEEERGNAPAISHRAAHREWPPEENHNDNQKSPGRRERQGHGRGPAHPAPARARSPGLRHGAQPAHRPGREARPQESCRAAQPDPGRHHHPLLAVQEAPLAGRGPTFYQLHLLFDKHAEEQLELVDLLAERVQILGGIAVGMPADVAELTHDREPAAGREEVPVHDLAPARSARTDLPGGPRRHRKAPRRARTGAPTTC